MNAPTPNELASKYDPSAVEAEVYADWLKNDCFKADPAKPGEPYCIVIPPPNVTGALHLGHGINNTLQDILIRMHRMRGFNTVWVPGIDHAGIATQAVVEKQLKERENKTRHDVGREGLVQRIWDWKQQYGDRILKQLQALGVSCDWSRMRFTLDEQCARAVRETFFKLFKDGLVYRGKRLVNWDAHLQTSISDDEIYHETVKTFLWHIKYPISGTFPHDTGLRPVPATHELGESSSSQLPDSQHGPEAHVTGESTRQSFMIVATTRPETLLGDTAVAVHSQDPRWNWAIGQFVELPLTGRKIPIIADDILVDMAFGSGVVKVTPGHDLNDYAVYTRHLGKADEIAIINLLNPDGTLNENAGKYAGLKRELARKKVVEDLGDLLVKEEPYETQVGHSDRSKTPVEPYLSDQWFVKMAPLAEPALEVVRNGTIKFFPDRHAQQYLSWLGEKRDWPISRQLWWGHRIPVWHFQWFGVCEDSNHSADVVMKYAETFGLQDEVSFFTSTSSCEMWACAKTPEAEKILNSIAAATKMWKDGVRDVTDFHSPELSLEQARRLLDLASCQFSDVFQDPDVLDTWFSSALWPHSTLGWPDATADLARWYPTSVLVTAREIITLWVCRMVMAGLYNMKQIPFPHVHIHTVIQDGDGVPMKKSLGNGVDPIDIIYSHGADALRFTLTQLATETQDVRLPVQLVCPHCGNKSANTASTKETIACGKCGKIMTRPVGTAKPTDEAPMARATSDKFDLGRNFCTKLWNAGRFVLSNLQNASGGAASATPSEHGVAKATPPLGGLADRWIVSRFNRAVDETNTALAWYRFDQYARTCYDFFWRDFCDWYVEAAKPAMKDPARAASTAAVLSSMLDGVLRLMHPMIPFITERLWWQLHPGTKLITAAWPTGGPVDADAEMTFSKLQEIIAAIRNVRNEYKIDPKKPVTVLISSPANFKLQIESSRELLEVLGVCTLPVVGTDLPVPANAARTAAAGCDIYVEGVIDPNAEAARAARNKETLEKKRTALTNRLASPAYTDKAPAHLVQQTRDELAAVEAELTKLLNDR